MASLTFQFLQLLIVPFKGENLFIWIGGILCCTWLFDKLFKLIRGDYTS